MKKFALGLSLIGALTLTACGSEEPEPRETVTVTAQPEAAQFQDGEFEDGEPGEVPIQSGSVEVNFGEELKVEDLVVAARINETKTLDETGTEPGVKVHILEIMIENNGDSIFNADSSTLDSITTDKGSAEQVFDGSQDEPFFGQIGRGQKATVRLLIKMPKGASTATATYTVGSSDDYFTVHFTGEI
ncbi:DUF4352 domain-containing protein [Brevibacterium sp. FAM 24630]|uniref:DUF4352 domain-containing protein n=1 Tax=unclassified Brevibacterium TaxID=2614124 RepID=UPI003C7B4DE9